MRRALPAVLVLLGLVPLATGAAPSALQTSDVAIVSIDIGTDGRIASAC